MTRTSSAGASCFIRIAKYRPAGPAPMQTILTRRPRCGFSPIYSLPAALGSHATSAEARSRSPSDPVKLPRPEPTMPRMIHCVKLGREAEGLDKAPLKGELGQRIFD